MSSSSTPAAKRRRVDAANETLKKPFRSPMVKRAPIQDDIGGTASSPAATPGCARARQGAHLSRLSTPSNLPDGLRSGAALPAASAKESATLSNPVPRHTAGKVLESKLQGDGDKDAEFLDRLSRRRKEAGLRARETEKQVELVRQAAHIESGKETSNEDLERLVRKWKGACRTAAEELFGLIRGRVDSMGGAAAWRETRQHTAWIDEEAAEEKKKRTMGEEADGREELEGLEEVQGSGSGPDEDEDGERVSCANPTRSSSSCKEPKLTVSRISPCT